MDLDGIRAFLASSDGRRPLRPIGIATIRIGAAALDDLPDVVRSVAAPGPIVILCDATRMLRDATDLKALIGERLAAVGETRIEVIGTGDAELHADEAALAEADRAIVGAGCVVSVGSGTITDIAKDATHRAGDIPLVVVQTAVSVNAFSDDMAVLLRHGVKRTVPSRWPTALIVDLPTIAAAPPDMNRAGLGELAAMFTAPADWYLAGALGMDRDWRPAPTTLFRHDGEALLEVASQIERHEADALALLARLMTLSGIALGVAGTSAPISGTEHIVSHLLDMDAEQAGRPLNFHGAQVGVAALAAAVAWQETLDTFDPGALDLDAAYPDPAALESRVRGAFARLDPSGAVGNECWIDVARKLERWSAARASFEAFLGAWPDHQAVLRSLVVDPAILARALSESGCATTFSGLARPITPELAQWAMQTAPLMRNRFVLADLRAWTGSWEPADVARTLAAAELLGAAE
jgi:glycerol-1-phosphate dehydrogenase [NAD(P)+]